MKCLGCGVELQTVDPKALGYTPKTDAEYCQRCFRLTHYGQLEYSFKEDVSSAAIFDKIRSLDVLMIWVVDLFDLESCFRQDISSYLENRDVLLVCTKRDLLPESVGNEKLGNYLLSRLKEKNIYVNGIVVSGFYGEDGKEEILHAVEYLRKGRDVCLLGTTNAGKSTILNHVFDMDKLTVSRYPGTTMDLIEMNYKDYKLYDTPGFNARNSVQILADDKDMKYIIPQKEVKPTIFQLYNDQSLAIGGICRIDILSPKDVTVACYFSRELKIHRGKVEDANRLWETQKGKLLVPTIQGSYFKNRFSFKKKYDKTDIVITGLGWISISGNYTKIVVSGSDAIEIVERKAMI